MLKVCTICARGGSKGVPGKNLKQINGKPLIVHTIEQAIASNLFDFIAISSDDPAILEIAKNYNILSILRPLHLADDASPKIPAIRHCVQEVELIKNVKFDICVDLDCTSPLRSISDISSCVDLIIAGQCSNVITAAPSRRSPYFNLVEVDSSGIVRLSKKLPSTVSRRQDAPKSFDMNASIYAWTRETLMTSDTLFHDTTRLYVMPEERSVDIDSLLDFRIVELLMKEKNNE